METRTANLERERLLQLGEEYSQKGYEVFFSSSVSSMLKIQHKKLMNIKKKYKNIAKSLVLIDL
ncbi:MAG: hypothetical protein PUP90_23250 [Nostoc sp. S4]|nr:hypothetical protein [Nostoc sp. S4]